MVHRIPFHLIPMQNHGCHIMCHARINGFKNNFLIDTGASLTVFDINRIKFINPEQSLLSYPKWFTGIGSAKIETHSTIIEEISFGNFCLFNFTILLIDLANINQAYASEDLDRVDGVLGGDFLLSLHARIDYWHKIMEIESKE